MKMLLVIAILGVILVDVLVLLSEVVLGAVLLVSVILGVVGVLGFVSILALIFSLVKSVLMLAVVETNHSPVHFGLPRVAKNFLDLRLALYRVQLVVLGKVLRTLPTMCPTCPPACSQHLVAASKGAFCWFLGV